MSAPKPKFRNSYLRLPADGKACIFISSELDEVVRTSHRILVLRDGAIIAELTEEEMNEHTIMHTIAGDKCHEHQV